MANNTKQHYCILRPKDRKKGDPYFVVNNRKPDRPVVAQFTKRQEARDAVKQMNAEHQPVAGEQYQHPQPSQLS